MHFHVHDKQTNVHKTSKTLDIFSPILYNGKQYKQNEKEVRI